MGASVYSCYNNCDIKEKEQSILITYIDGLVYSILLHHHHMDDIELGLFGILKLAALILAAQFFLSQQLV